MGGREDGGREEGGSVGRREGAGDKRRGAPRFLQRASAIPSVWSCIAAAKLSLPAEYGAGIRIENTHCRHPQRKRKEKEGAIRTDPCRQRRQWINFMMAYYTDRPARPDRRRAGSSRRERGEREKGGGGGGGEAKPGAPQVLHMGRLLSPSCRRDALGCLLLVVRHGPGHCLQL